MCIRRRGQILDIIESTWDDEDGKGDDGDDGGNVDNLGWRVEKKAVEETECNLDDGHQDCEDKIFAFEGVRLEELSCDVNICADVRLFG